MPYDCLGQTQFNLTKQIIRNFIMETTTKYQPSIESKIRHLQKTFFKERIKFLANAIKGNEYTLEQYAKVMGLEKIPMFSPSSHTLKHLFRHIHIAASTLRGRTREQIERPRENNLPNESLIKKYLDEAEKHITQAEAEMRQQEVQVTA
jgi:hypothetical protein